MNPLVILVAVLGFITLGGLGFVVAFAGSSDVRMERRAKAIAGAPPEKAATRAKLAQQDASTRRRQILQTLKDQDRRQRKASVSLNARLKQTGLNISVSQFWIASSLLGVVVVVCAFVFRAPPWAALLLGLVAALGLPRWGIGFQAQQRRKKFTAHFSDAIVTHPQTRWPDAASWRPVPLPRLRNGHGCQRVVPSWAECWPWAFDPRGPDAALRAGRPRWPG